jgi:Heterokaryon incompatibility protein (HET)
MQSMGMLWSHIVPSLDIDADASSVASFDKICSWLSLCTKDHPKCSSDPAPLPTRVIDIGESGSTSSCRLYEPKGEIAEYVTLSHCWGNDPSQILKTDASTLKDYTTCIVWESLSKTFQDAISITRRLGIRYIWIDSLCIIQNDVADWERESANMANIYQKSYLTLAAAASSSGAGGLFVDRDGEFLEINLPQSTFSKPPSIRVRRERPHRSLNPTAKCDPLSTRAWAYQERLLARRIIHFSSEELIWECRTKEDCECGGKSNYFDEIHFGSEKARFENMRLKGRYNDQWHELVQVYTMLDLSFEDDRLPALSGIASQLFYERQYLAGLRKDRLHEDLFWIASFWKTYPKASLTRRPVKYRGPSWSWTSLEAPIQFYDWRSSFKQRSEEMHDPSVNLEIIEAVCTPRGDPFGQVSDGFLVISGVLLEAALLPLVEPDVNADTYELQITHKYSINHPTRRICWGTYHPDHTEFQSCYRTQQTIWLLIFGRDMWSISSYDGTIMDMRAVMLVLKKCPGQENSYKRIGWAEYDGQKPFEGCTEDWKPSTIRFI